jgi:hypothetical protein
MLGMSAVWPDAAGSLDCLAGLGSTICYGRLASEVHRFSNHLPAPDLLLPLQQQ